MRRRDFMDDMTATARGVMTAATVYGALSAKIMRDVMTAKIARTFAARMSAYIIVIGVIIFGGCASSSHTRKNPFVSNELAVDLGAGRVGVLEPEIFLYDIFEGGVAEYRDDWSASASRQMALSAALTLKRRGYHPLLIPNPSRSREFFQLVTPMRHHSAVFREEYFAAGRSPFVEPLNFSIGPDVIDGLCDLYSVDGFLLIYGVDGHERFDDGRGGTFIAAVLAERGGRVSWYRHAAVSGGLDMREEEHSEFIMRVLFEQ